MDLFLCDTTFREIAGDKSTFPESLRRIILQSVQRIPIEDMEQLLDRHEADANNFDRRIESHLREAVSPDVRIYNNHRVSRETRFNSDIVIDAPSTSVCIEIEKGYMSRFELDILKMQAHASTSQEKDNRAEVHGVFIVPADNVVANHISGNSRESSFKYVTRLSRLVVNIKPRLLQDILVVGYSTSPFAWEPTITRSQNPTRVKRRPGKSAVDVGTPLVDVDTIRQKLSGYPLTLIVQLRDRLISAFPDLREKLNPKSRYLGYANDGQSDAVYVYIQKKRLILDVRVSNQEAENLRIQGFRVVSRNNYQARNGWLTGVVIPHDTDKLNVVVGLAFSALTGQDGVPSMGGQPLKCPSGCSAYPSR